MPEVKDSGQRYVNENGGQRDTSEGKPNFKYVPSVIIEFANMYFKDNSEELTLREIFLECHKVAVGGKNTYSLHVVIYSMLNIIGKKNVYEGLKSFALFMQKCAEKYSFENWRLLTSNTDKDRFKESLLRHSVQALFNQEDEFHREAVVFNAMCLLLNFETEAKSE